MPKFTYTQAKGIEQTSGSGFVVSDVPITHSTYTVSTDDLTTDTTITDTSQVIHLTVAGAFILKLPDGAAIGEEKLIVIAANGGGSNLTIKDSGGTQVKGSTAVAQYAVIRLVYTEASPKWTELT